MSYADKIRIVSKFEVQCEVCEHAVPNDETGDYQFPNYWAAAEARIKHVKEHKGE
jgi:hypothetical protein